MATVRLATARDASACRGIYVPYVTDTAVSFESSPPGEDEFTERLRNVLRTYPWLVCESDGDIVGFAYASQHRERDAYQWAVESSVYVDDRYHRHGVGRGLYESLFAVLRVQGFYDAYAGITLPNETSVDFHTAMGFEPIGVYPDAGYKHGEWRDVQWWHLQLQPHDDDPESPIPLRTLEHTRELREAVTTGEETIEL